MGPDAGPSLAQIWYKETAEQSRSCSTLPFTIFLWLVFIAQQVSHREVQTGFNINRMQKEFFEIGETLVDNYTEGCGADAEEVFETKGGVQLYEVFNLESPKSLIDWIEEKVVEALWQERNRAGHDTYIGHFNKVIGGVRLVQTRLKPTDCRGSDRLVSYYNETCYEPGSKDSKTINGLDLEGFRANDEDEFVYWLDIARSQDETLANLDLLREKRWLGSATSKVDLQVLTYSGAVTMFALTRVTFNLDRTGFLTSQRKVTSWKSNIYATNSSIALDVVFWCMLIWLLITQVRGVVKAVRSRRLAQVISLHLTLNVSIIGIGFAIGLYFGYVNLTMQDLSDKVTDVPAPPVLGGSWEIRQGHLDDVYKQFATMQTLRDVEESLVFIYVCVLVMKFFRSFDVVPRLAIVADTLKHSASDVIHFMLVSGTIFLSFTTGAYFMFGAKLEEWSNWGKAMSTSFRALMGDFDFDAMYIVAPVSATIWFWSFMALIFMVMLNMLLAIILDTYNEVKAEAPAMQGIYDIGLDIVAYHWASLRMSPADLMRCWQSGDDDDEKTERIGKKQIPGRIARHIVKCLHEIEDREEEEDQKEEAGYLEDLAFLAHKPDGSLPPMPLGKQAFVAAPSPPHDGQYVVQPPGRVGERPRPKEDIPVLPAGYDSDH